MKRWRGFAVVNLTGRESEAVYKFRSRKKSWLQRNGLSAFLMLLGSAGVSFGFLFPAVSNFDSNARVFSDGLNIELDRSSPAFAALEDAWMTEQQNLEPAQLRAMRTPAIELSVNSKHSAVSVAEKIIRANQREQALISQERRARENQAKLYAQAATEALRRMASNVHESRPAPTRAPAVVETNEVIERPTQTISLTDLKMSREELLGSLFLPIAQSTKSVHKPVAVAARRMPSLPSAPSRPERVERTQDDQAKTSEQGDQPSQPNTARQLIVSGPIEFTDGLALSNPQDRLIVYREFDGEIFEAGQVWMREGRYEIFVEETIGTLIAELRTPYDDVIGRGTYDLARLPQVHESEREVKNIAVKIAPVPQGMTGIALASDSKSKKEIPVPGARVSLPEISASVLTSKSGTFKVENYFEGSNAIVSVSRSGLISSVSVAQSGDENEISLMTPGRANQIKQASFNESAKSDHMAGIVWGKIQKNGKAISGAQVELMTTDKALRPIYFNEALEPDTRLTATSSNGLYAFFPVPQGTHAVQAKAFADKPDIVSEPQLFPVEGAALSKVDIEVSAKKKIRLKAFDAFNTSMPLPAEVAAPGADYSTGVGRNGIGEYQYAKNKTLSFIDAYAGERYAKVRVSLRRSQRLALLPMIQTEWIESIKGAMKIDTEANTGTIVGFVQGSQPYRVSLDLQGGKGNMRIVYFDNRGQPTEQNYGEPGGGFVVLNAAEGYRSITIEPSGSSKVFSAVALVEDKIINVINTK